MIEKIFFGVAAALVLEGLMLSLFPGRIKYLVKIIEKTPTSQLSFLGLCLLVLGILCLGLVDI